MITSNIFMLTPAETALAIEVLRALGTPESRMLCNKLHFPVDGGTFMRAFIDVCSDPSESAPLERLAVEVQTLCESCPE